LPTRRSEPTIPRMTYFVNLVQRGISANSHPVSGKSGKGYGTAVNSPQHGGVIFKMSLQDYMNAAHDLCGNTIAGQQWVPEFVMEAGAQAQARPKCDRCPRPSVAIWDRFPFCEIHAPANATWYDESQRPASAAAPAPTDSPDVLPKVNEPPMTPGVVDKRAQADLPREQLAPSFVGSEDENVGAATGPKAPVVMPDPPATTGPAESGTTGASGPLEIPPAGFVAGASGPAAETGPSGAVAQPPEQKQKGDAVAVVAAITEGVIKAVVPQLQKMIDERLSKQQPPPAPPEKRTPRPPRKKAAPPVKEPSEFQKLQQKAKALDIRIFGKGREALEAAIKEKEAPPQPE
jgi:hypothetical protein